MSVSHILEGWANVIKDEFGLLKPELKELSEKRLLICNNCSLRNNNTCSTKRTGFVVKTFRYKDEEVNRI